MVHGFLGGSDQWRLQAPLAKDRQVVRVDLPGFGKNARMPAIDRIEGFAEWVLSETASQGIDRFDLLGHSMGGMIVQEMVRMAPDRVDRLVLYGTGAVGELPGRFEPISASIDRLEAEGAQSTAHRISATWFREFAKSAEYPGCARIAEKATVPAMVAGLRAMQEWSGEAALASISSRTLVVWGDLDRSYPWPQIERLWRTIPNCNLAVVPNCAHAVHAENPEIFNALISSFVNRKQ